MDSVQLALLSVGALLQVVGYGIAIVRVGRTGYTLAGWRLPWPFRRRPPLLQGRGFGAGVRPEGNLDMVVRPPDPETDAESRFAYLVQRLEDLEDLCDRRHTDVREDMTNLHSQISAVSNALVAHAADESQRTIRDFLRWAKWEIGSGLLFVSGVILTTLSAAGIA